MKRFETKIAGTTHENEDGTPRMRLLTRLYDHWWSEGLHHEVKVEFRAEPENKYDPDAVGVWLVEPEVLAGRLGFVPRERARLVKLALRAGVLHSVEFEDMNTGGGGGVWGLLSVKVG